MIRSTPPPVRTSSAPSSAIPAVMPDRAPSGVSHSTAVPRAEGASARQRVENSSRVVLPRARPPAVRAPRASRRAPARSPVPPELGLERRRAIGQLRRERGGPQVDAEAEYHVMQSVSAGGCLGEDAGELPPRAGVPPSTTISFGHLMWTGSPVAARCRRRPPRRRRASAAAPPPRSRQTTDT